MSSLIRDEILINNVTHVCPNHINGLLTGEVTALACLCHLFHQPHHITADAEYRRIMNAFGQRSDDNDATTAKSALLSELGILPPGVTPTSVAATTTLRLASPDGFRRMCTRQTPVHEYVMTGKFNHALFSREVIVYMDPAPTDVGRSYHAMSFVTRAEEEGGNQHYVILAAEEFETTTMDPKEKDWLRALAKVFMVTCSILVRQYSGYFHTFTVAPEANSIPLDRFWGMCGVLYGLDESLCDTIILSTVIPANVPPLRREKHITGPPHKRAYLQAAEEVKRIERNSSASYRIGYILGADKVARISSFYADCYNPGYGNTKDLTCASLVWSQCLNRVGIPHYIAVKMETLELRPKRSSGGKTTYKIGGKSQIGGSFVCDDLAVSVAMSVSLCGDILDGAFNGKLVRLDPVDLV